MRLLLDTHSFLWFCQDDLSLSVRAKTMLEDPATRKLVSLASCWEIAIKAGRVSSDSENTAQRTSRTL